MIHATRPAHRGDGRSPTDPRLLGSPLDFIAEDHMREREICTLLDRIAADPAPDPDQIAQALAFLVQELPQHLRDEDDDLYPMMLDRCAPEDEISRVLARLELDHGQVREDTPKVIGVLADLAKTGRPMTETERRCVAAYASHARRHLIVENAIIMPLARARLSEEDLDRLRLGMLRRRGLDRILARYRPS